MIRPIAKPTPRFVEKMLKKREREREAIRVRAAVRRRDGGKCRACGKPAFERDRTVGIYQWSARFHAPMRRPHEVASCRESVPSSLSFHRASLSGE